MIEDLWYKNAIIYSLDVGTFMDTSGDGVGDFEGLMRRLDYLSGLGITTLWLLPFQPSPRRDDGYDITDYYGVDPRYGTLGDFVEFTHQARQRGIRVLMDLVLNHTSDQHPWFQSARRDPGSKYRDWYVWSKKRPPDWNRGMAFPGVQKSTWTWDAQARAYYYHRFYSFQPDLDTSNPDVQAEMRRIMGFWLQAGVSGFRVDAVPFLIETKGARRKRLHRFEMLTEMRSFLQWRAGDAVLLGEANVTPDLDLEYFGDEGDRMHMMFNFPVNQHMFYAFATGDVRPLAKALEVTRQRPESAQWAHFVRNNDELDLGRLTESQRQAVFAAMGPRPDMQLYQRGIRRRFAPMVDGDSRRIEMGYSLMFTLPGTPVLRYGEEIGMGDDLAQPERNSVRTPMQWTAEPNGGFTRGRRPKPPVISGGHYGFERVNVADQRRDPHSVLNWTERMIRTRKECPEFGWGEWTILSSGSKHVLALRYDWRGTAVIAVHNFASRPVTVTLEAGTGTQRLSNLLSADEAECDPRGRYTMDLEAYGYRWLRVGSFDEVARRSKR